MNYTTETNEKTIWAEETPNTVEIEKTETAETGTEVDTTEIKVSADAVKASIAKQFGTDVSTADIKILIELKERLAQDDTLTNPYYELPSVFQRMIREQFASLVDTEERKDNISNLNFISKEFINTVFDSAELEQCLKEFKDATDTLEKRATAENIMIDSRYDSMLETVTNMYENDYDHISVTDPDKAERIKNAYNTLNQAMDLTNIIKDITDNPSHLNRTYKDIRVFGNWAQDYNAKFCGDGDSVVKYKTLDALYISLKLQGLKEDPKENDVYAKTICGLIYKDLIKIDKTDTIGQWYTYWLSDMVYNLHKTTTFGDVSSRLNTAIKTIVDKIDDLVASKELRNKKKRR